MTTYTHVGRKPHVGYVHCGAKRWGHHLPKTGQCHALNGGPDYFSALCGESVEQPRYTEFGEDADRNTVPADAAAPAITCSRCRKILGLTRFAVQLTLPYASKWWPAKGHGNYATKEEAEAACRELGKNYPRQSFRVRRI